MPLIFVASSARRTRARAAHPVRLLAVPMLFALALVGCSERLEWREFRSDDGYSVMLAGRALE